MSTKLDLGTLKVESFEPVAARGQETKQLSDVTDSYGSGLNGPYCRSLWPNCEPTIRCI